MGRLNGLDGFDTTIGATSLAIFISVKLPDADNVQGIDDQVGLDVKIEGRVEGKRGWEVDLQDPGLQILVENDVEAEEVKTVRLDCPSWSILCPFNGSNNLALYADDGLYDGVVDSLPYSFHVDSKPLQVAL